MAYSVCQAAGLTTAAYSFGYVAGWSGGDPKQVSATAERVVIPVRPILDRAGLVETDGERNAVALTRASPIHGVGADRLPTGKQGGPSEISDAR